MENLQYKILLLRGQKILMGKFWAKLHGNGNELVINKTTILKKDFCFGNRRRYNASFTPGPRQTFESRGAGFETANETCFESSQITTSTPREKGTQASETGTSPEFAMNPKTMEAEISVIRKPTYEKNKNNKKGTQKVQNYGYRQSGNNQGNIIHHSDRSRADEFPVSYTHLTLPTNREV